MDERARASLVSTAYYVANCGSEDSLAERLKKIEESYAGLCKIVGFADNGLKKQIRELIEEAASVTEGD